MHFRNTLIAAAFIAALASSACDRRPPPPNAPPSPPGASTSHPTREIASARFAWGASFLPSRIPQGAPDGKPLGASVLFVDFEEVRRHPGLEPLLKLGFGAADLAVELAVAARDIQCFWRFEAGGIAPGDPPPLSPISIARVADPEGVLERLNARHRDGKIRRVQINGQEWFEDAPTLSFESVIERRVVRVRTRACVDWIEEVRSGRRPSMSVGDEVAPILNECPNNACSLFLTTNRRYRLLSFHGETLQMAGSAVTDTQRIGILKFASPELAEDGLLPVAMQLADEPFRTRAIRKGALIILGAPLDPGPADLKTRVEETGTLADVAAWSPRGGRPTWSVQSFPVPDTPEEFLSPRAVALGISAIPGIRDGDIERACVRSLRLSDGNDVPVFVMFTGAAETWPRLEVREMLRMPPAATVTYGGLRLHAADGGSLWWTRGRLLCWVRDFAVLLDSLRTRFELEPALATAPEIAELLGTLARDVQAFRISPAADREPAGATFTVELTRPESRMFVTLFSEETRAREVARLHPEMECHGRVLTSRFP